jgi:peptidyl-prolyl cis-trans isomerase A (cyclophilin A)
MSDPDRVHILLDTELGEIEMVLHPSKAPITTANFLKYVEEGHYDQGRFHRSVTLENQEDRKVRIQVIQAGINRERRLEGFPAILLERTSKTGLRHRNGTVSMARGTPDSARSDFFICIGNQPSLDFGGARNPDGQGFAAFGSVIRGMDVVRAIQAAPKEAQDLQPPIRIKSARRLSAATR